MRSLLKHETAEQILFTFPAQDDLLGPSTVTVYKTDDGSLRIDHDLHSSFGSVSWQEFLTHLEADCDVTEV